MRVLDDLRVIELSETAAAAFAGRLCADAGAEVVLVEPPEGHALRREGPFVGDVSAVHLHVNAGKRSVVLDATTQAEELRALIDEADVFITGWPTSVLEPLGLDTSALRERAPGLVITQVTPFGDTGPYRDYAGTNLVELALGGQLKITGDPDKPPLSNYGSQAEFQAGLSAFVREEAQRRGDAEAIAALSAIETPYATRDALGTQRQWLGTYRGSIYAVDRARESLPAALFGREYTLGTRLRFFDCFQRTIEALWDGVDDFDVLTQIPRLDVPVFFFTGRHDWNTPYPLVEEWAAQLEAPHVEIVWFDEAGHVPPIEAPEAFQRALIEKLNPLAPR